MKLSKAQPPAEPAPATPDTAVPPEVEGDPAEAAEAWAWWVGGGVWMEKMMLVSQCHKPTIPHSNEHFEGYKPKL